MMNGVAIERRVNSISSFFPAFSQVNYLTYTLGSTENKPQIKLYPNYTKLQKSIKRFRGRLSEGGYVHVLVRPKEIIVRITSRSF